MVYNDRFVMTDEEVEQQRKDALYAHSQAVDELDRLILKAKTESKKLYKIAGLLGALEREPENPLREEVPILSLASSEYEGLINMTTVKALANTIAAARRELADTITAKRQAGFRD